MDKVLGVSQDTDSSFGVKYVKEAFINLPFPKVWITTPFTAEELF